MAPEQFKQIWTISNDNLSPLAPNSLLGLNLRPDTVEFLATVGLPSDAAPFLSFVQNNANSYNTINKLTEHYDFLEPAFYNYIVIGSCSDGDVIAINTNNNDQIEQLDHKDNFSSHFFNSSVNSLAECLVSYQNFVQTILKEIGEDACLNGDFTDEHFQTLKEALAKADKKAVTEDGFWKSQLEMELARGAENKK